MKKGFTLIELIGVIIVLAVIGIITFPIVSNSIKSSKEKAYNSQISIITESARKWAIDNTKELSETVPASVSVDTLIRNGYITKTENGQLIDPTDPNKTMAGCVLITYTDTYNQYIYEYVETCNN